MEELMKRPVSNQQSGLNGVEFGRESQIPEALPFPNQAGSRNYDYSADLDPVFAIASENPQASDFGVPSSDGKYESAILRPDLICFSVLHHEC